MGIIYNSNTSAPICEIATKPENMFLTISLSFVNMQ